MIVVTTTFVGNELRHLEGALMSAVKWVDACLVLSTAERTPENEAIFQGILERVKEHGEVMVVSWPWRDDFAAARNAALDLAQAYGADWAITLDSDEALAGNLP